MRHAITRQLQSESARTCLPRAIAAAAAMLALAVPVAACGSSTAASSNAQIAKQTCKQIEAALSDGPDPEADPVGYAEAQVLPLRRMHTSDPKLRQAVSRLASAYAAVVASGGTSRQAKSAVAAASGEIDAICPGASS